jgi:hypothetical protein
MGKKKMLFAILFFITSNFFLLVSYQTSQNWLKKKKKERKKGIRLARITEQVNMGVDDLSYRNPQASDSWGIEGKLYSALLMLSKYELKKGSCCC